MNYTYPVQTVSFEKALPVWAWGREHEMNLWLSFRTVAKKAEKTILRLTGSSAYDVKVNGEFIAFGPARAAHNFYRVDELDLSAYIREDAVITITVAGYNCNSFYHVDQPAFLCAELIQDDEITAATGSHGFLCRVMTEHEQKVERYCNQRTFCEVYNLSEALNAWNLDASAEFTDKDFALVILAKMEQKTYIARGSYYNTYDRVPAEKITSRLTYTKGDFKARIRYPHYIVSRKPNRVELKMFQLEEVTTDSFIDARNIEVSEILPTDEVPTAQTIEVGQGVTYKMAFNTTGKVALDAVCEEDTEIIITYDEFMGENGLVDFRRMYTVNVLIFRMKKGTYHLSTFEPYTLGAMHVFVTKGKATVSNVHMVYFGANQTERRYNGTDEELRTIFNAAVETYRQNTFTIYMDCPSRERAGWLCDSFFTSRVEKVLTGKSEVERAFLENFFLPDSFRALAKGMFPMCYPGDQYDGGYIPNWAMWLVLELEEYLARTGDRKFVDDAKPRIMALVDFFKGYENKDGILEKLDRWVFVEWSEANNLVQDISFPSNMLYARMLVAVANLYGDDSFREKAKHIKEYINANAMTDEGFYCDNAVYGEDGIARLSGKCTETCQYYAFFCDITSPEENPELWNRMVHDFGPERVVPHNWPEIKEDAKWRHIYASNAFIGNYLRLDLLHRYGEHEKLVENIRGFFIKMATLTGTLWENETPTASCNHGFASHVLYWMDGLGMID